jgi:hypothetical protein
VYCRTRSLLEYRCSGPSRLDSATVAAPVGDLTNWTTFVGCFSWPRAFAALASLCVTFFFFRLLDRNHINAAPTAKTASGPITTPAIHVLLVGADCAIEAAVGEGVDVSAGEGN